MSIHREPAGPIPITLIGSEISFFGNVLTLAIYGDGSPVDDRRESLSRLLIDTPDNPVRVLPIAIEVDDLWHLAGALYALADSLSGGHQLAMLHSFAGSLFQRTSAELRTRAEAIEALLRSAEAVPK